MARDLHLLSASWDARARAHVDYQDRNPFSGHYPQHWRPSDEEYGRPPAGSKTEARGKQAAVHVSGEISQLCQVIREVGTMTSTAEFKVTFRQLFSSYERISNKLVGILLRARRQGCVRFDGEILFQGRDDDVVITLLPEFARMTT